MKAAEKEIRAFYKENKQYFIDIAKASPSWRELNDADFRFLAEKYDRLNGQMDLQGDIIYIMQNM